MRHLILFAFLLGGLTGFCGEIKYPVNAIPQPLLKNAHVVKRMEEVEFRIINTGETVLRKRYALTILNENGDDHAGFMELYDKQAQITSIDGALFDRDGNLLKKVRNKDIQDLTASDDNNLIDDNRRRVHHFYHRVYPYTVEYEFVQKFNNTLFFPHWMPQEGEHFAVEQSRFVIIYPQDYAVRYKTFNYNGDPQLQTEKNSKIMAWQINALPAIEIPYASPGWKELTTMVFLAPSDFEIQGYKGNMNTWKDFGKFQTSLNQGRDQLPPDVVQTVKQLVANVAGEREKVQVLYEYLQKNNRYISIQLGLGGWQPFEASYVAKKGYGDCKALTNYMYSLLKAAGIRSNYTLVYAGNDRNMVIDDFPVNRFNHVILCVPLAKDSIWLECTSATDAAGYMGSFTGNRKALLINEEGGFLVSTPRYDLKDNNQRRAVKARLTEEGNLEMDVETRYTGLQQDDISSLIHQLSKDEVKKVLNRYMELSTYDIVSFHYKEQKGRMPEINEQLQVVVPNYATVTGKRIFINPNLLNRGGVRLTAEEGRKVDYVYDMSWHDEDRSEIEIPAGYKIETPLKEVNLKTRFGSYAMTVKLEGNKLIYTRIREQYAGRFPAADGKELLHFLEEIYRADHQKMVLVKQ